MALVLMVNRLGLDAQDVIFDAAAVSMPVKGRKKIFG